MWRSMGPNHTAIIIVPYRICQGDIIMIIHIQIFDKSNLSYFFTLLCFIQIKLVVMYFYLVMHFDTYM